ncbi:PAS domain S-box protein [Rhodobacteraceae bacterium LMO-12]|nr:PAS domain S-box protein [Rhodobacteraceae bacterium LMO-JJ12]
MTEHEHPLQLGDIRFAQIFLNSGIAMMILQQDGKVAFSTGAAARIFGLEPAQIAGRDIEGLLPDTPISSLLALVESPAKDGSIRSIMGRHISGRSITLSLHITLSSDDENQKIVSVVFRDISDELEVEKKLLEDLHLSENLLRGVRIGTFEFCLKTSEVIVSRMWRELMEIGEEDSAELLQEWRSRVHPDDLDAALASFYSCQTSESGLANYDFRYLSKASKKWRWMRFTISIAERDHLGEVIKVTGAATDVTDSKNVEINNQRFHGQFQSAFENASIGMALVGLDGSFLRVNSALCEFLGYPQSQLLKSDFQSLTHPDDLNADLEFLNELVGGKIPSYSMEKRYIRKDGAIVWGLLSVSLFYKPDGQPDHAISQIVDVTEQHRLAELKSEFVATISHELRTPLTSILGALGLLGASKSDNFSDLALRLIDIAQKNGRQLNELISDILDFEKFSSGAIQFDLRKVQILQLVEQAVMVNETYAEKFDVQCSIECKDRTLTGVTEPKRFNQVMTNLLSNAAKFADPGSMIEVNIEEVHRHIKVSIKNQGPSIPEEFRNQLFEPFLQAENSATRSRGGTGLGLSIVKRIVEDSGGAIDFDSSPERGTTFWFTVPMDLPEQALDVTFTGTNQRDRYFEKALLHKPA